MTKFIEHRNGRRGASKDIIVLYHAECTDGFTAAWAASLKLGNAAQYFPVVHQVPPPEGIVGKTVYMLDITYDAPTMARLMKDNPRVTAIDHHITAEQATKSTQDFRYAVDKSGARLAWEYFHPDEPVPYLVKVVEDADLHRFVLPDSLALFDWLDIFDFEFKTYSKLSRQLESLTGRARALRQGRLIKQHREKVVERLVSNSAYEIQFGEYRVRAATTEIYHSEVGNALAVGRPFGLTWRVRRDGVCVSLRSDEKGIDVSQLAKQFGGGGHVHAAGFLVRTVDDLPFRPVSE